jgi:RHS repeat-associated protein
LARYNPCSADFSGTYSASVLVHTGDALYGRVSHTNTNVNFNWSSSNQLTVSTTVGIPFESIGHGPDGLLATMWAAGSSTTAHVGYDLLGMGGLPQRVADYAGVTPSASYFYGVGSDRPLDIIVGGVSYYYHRDALSSTTALTDASGNVAASYRYDAYGNVLSGSSDAVRNPLRFDALASDPTSGLVYDRARFYDPSTGRFLTPDPMGGGYAFAGDNPVNNVDPTGTWAVSWKSINPGGWRDRLHPGHGAERSVRAWHCGNGSAEWEAFLHGPVRPESGAWRRGGSALYSGRPRSLCGGSDCRSWDCLP